MPLYLATYENDRGQAVIRGKSAHVFTCLDEAREWVRVVNEMVIYGGDGEPIIRGDAHVYRLHLLGYEKCEPGDGNAD